MQPVWPHTLHEECATPYEDRAVYKTAVGVNFLVKLIFMIYYSTIIYIGQLNEKIKFNELNHQ